MHYFKTMMFATLLLAADVLAVGCTYSVTHTDVASGKPGQRNQKLVNVDQDKADSIVANMATWSGGKYTAKKARVAATITVAGSTTKSQSTAMIQDMQHIVQTNYKAKSKSPSPEPSSPKSPKSPKKGGKRSLRSARFAEDYEVADEE